MEVNKIKYLMKNFLMEVYDIRPSLAEKAVEEMFARASEFISHEESEEKQ